MPVEEGYDARVMPQPAAQAPLVNPAAMGAQIGQAIEQAGDTVHQIQLRAYEQKRAVDADRQASDFAHRFALHRQNMDGIEAQRQTGPIDGYSMDLRSANDAARDGLLSGITEGKVRRLAERQLDEYSTQLNGKAVAWEQGQLTLKTVSDANSVMDLGSNRIRQGMDPQHYADETKAWHDYVGGLNNVTPAIRDKLLKEGDQKYAIAYINHLNDTNPHAAVALIDAGAFNEVLTPEQIDAARNGAQVEVRRADAELQRQQAVARAAYHESIATVEERARQGIDVSADLPGLLQQARQFGDSSGEEKLKGMARDSAFAKVYNPQTPLQRQHAISEITRIPPAKRTADQQAELKWLTDHGGALDSQFQSDPVSFVREHGKPGEQPPELNPQDPRSFVARAQWQARMQQAYGYMAPLSQTEAKAMQATLQQTAGGRAEVADTLAQFPANIARQAARQVAPADAYLQHVVALPPDNRHMALEGAKARKGDPKVIDAASAEDKEQFGVTARFLDQALITAHFDDRNAVLSSAQDIAAYHVRNDGLAMTPGLWLRSVNEALGARRRDDGQWLGGLGNWQGHAFAVPRGLTAQQFTNNVFIEARAHPERGPVNPDGSPANLRNAFPVQVDEDLYQFRVGNNFVSGKDGKPWQYRVSRR